MDNCVVCGKKLVHNHKGGKRKMYCSSGCKSKARAKQTSVCVRCGETKPRAEYPKFSSTCIVCTQESPNRTCEICKKTKEITYFSGTRHICRYCERKVNKDYYTRTFYRSCDRCHLIMSCSWLVQSNLAPLCFEPDEKNDPHYFAQLDPLEQKLALALLEDRCELT